MCMKNYQWENPKNLKELYPGCLTTCKRSLIDNQPCGQPISEAVYKYCQKNFPVPLCFDCQKKLKRKEVNR